MKIDNQNLIDAERDLLNTLRGGGRGGLNGDEPLSNIKNEMGSVRNIIGNPMFKAEISLQITSFIWDVVPGVMILPAALPAALQNSIPFCIFGLTDYFAGYLNFSRIAPPNIGWWLLPLQTGIINFQGFPAPFAALPFLPVVSGDMIFCFQDAVPAGVPNFQIFILIHCNNVAYSTFLNSFASDLCVCNQIRYFVPAANIIQLVNPLIFGYQSLFGKLATDSIDPRMYQTPDEFQNQIADIPVKFPIDKNLIIASQLDIFCQQISMTFFIEKVEPLTLRSKYK